MKTYKIACIPGDGIGKEVVPAGQAVWRHWRGRRAALPSSSAPSLGRRLVSRSRHIIGQGLANPVGTCWSCVLLSSILAAGGSPAADAGDRLRHGPP
jgi:isocitrate/isopropylmalate dehydrogenase